MRYLYYLTSKTNLSNRFKNIFQILCYANVPLIRFYVFNFDVFNASFKLVKNEDMKARRNLFFSFKTGEHKFIALNKSTVVQIFENLYAS